MRETEIELGVRHPTDDEIAAAKETLQNAGKGRTVISARSTHWKHSTLQYPATVRMKLQAIRIGDVGIASSPCETFVETGLAIKRESPLPLTFTIELANGYNGYLPTPEQHAAWRIRDMASEVELSGQRCRT